MADILIPAIGESITEVTLTQWLVEDGVYVNEGDLLCEIESDKATLEMPSEHSGVIKIMAEEGSELEIGVKIGEIDTDAKAEDKPQEGHQESKSSEEGLPKSSDSEKGPNDKPYPSPSAAKIMREKGIDSSEVSGSGKDGRITKADALASSGSGSSSSSSSSSKKPEVKKELTEIEQLGIFESSWTESYRMPHRTVPESYHRKVIVIAKRHRRPNPNPRPSSFDSV